MKSLSLSFLFCLLTFSLTAEQIFVYFDGACGDRIRYEQAVMGQPRMEYYAYQFEVGPNTKLILETGAEGDVRQTYLPQGYVYCNDPRLNTTLADRVNSKEDRVFVLLPTADGQYLVQPVVMALVFERNGSDLTYQSPLTGFQFNSDNGIIGVNLAYNNPNAKVYFEGRENNACSGLYLFRQLKTGGAYPVIDYKLVPEIGIVERRLGSDGVSTSGGIIAAQAVNGQPLAQYLASICAANTARVAQYGNGPIQPRYPQVAAPAAPGGRQYAPESANVGGNPAVPSTPTTISHTVSKGETLYAISRKYNTSVDALKATNGLTNNTVYPGQQLSVTTTTTAVAATTTVPTVPYSSGSVATSNPGASLPTPYSGYPSTQATPSATYGTDPMASRSGEAVYGEDIHIVQPGETVASVALRYGYTSAKLREMNDLGANEVLKVGQRIATSDCNCPPAVPTPANDLTPGPTRYETVSGGQAPMPTSYGSTPVGTPVGASSTPSYREPVNVNAQGDAGGYRGGAPTTIGNDPAFGEPVNPASSTTTSMGQLESGAVPSTYGGTPLTPGADYSSPAQPSDRAYHIVQEGERLQDIATRYRIPLETLRDVNQFGPYYVVTPFQKVYLN